MTIRQEIDEWVDDNFGDATVLMADGFEEAFLGVGICFNKYVSIFDYEKCLRKLRKDGLSIEEAREYMEFNVTGAYVGERTPAFLIKYKKAKKPEKHAAEQYELPFN